MTTDTTTTPSRLPATEAKPASNGNDSKAAQIEPTPEDCIVLTKTGIIVHGRGLQNLGQRVKATKTLKRWKQEYAFLSAVLQSGDYSVGKQQDALTAAGLSIVGLDFNQSGALAKIKPDPSQFTIKA